MTPLSSLWIKDVYALNNLRRLLRRESIFKVVFILAFAFGLMGGFFVLFLDAFQFLSGLGGGTFMITRRLFSLFFLGLGGMLVISNIVTSYSTTFRSRETTFLLTAPIDTRSLVTYKYLESTLLSSWAFLFLIIPFTSAYTWNEQLGPIFALWTAVFSIPYVLLCGGIGSLIALLIVRWAPRNRTLWLTLALLGLALAIKPFLGAHPVNLQDQTSFVLNRLLPGLQVASHPLAPNHWTAEGIMSLTSGDYAHGILLWLTLVSNMLMVLLLIQWVGARTFFSAYQRVAGAGGVRRRSAELLAWLGPALRFLPNDIRGMILKDIRTFLRDPLQWSQALIFFGLLAIYFSSFRAFRYDQLPDIWRNLIVFLNIFSVASVICSLASRFVFPQLSLEGHSFWILGLAPTGMRRILMTKFLLAASTVVLVSASLMGLATWMLQAGPALTAISIGVAVAISISVCALSTGLGAIFLDLKQPNPVAIISGFGGTMNLALSLGLMLACIVPFGLIWHWHVMGRITEKAFIHANILSTVWLVVITLLATLIPLWLGIRNLSRREY
jgi:ABC-2 type transport system permease protein